MWIDLCIFATNINYETLIFIVMEINNIGNNAGLIWNALNANGKMTETKLKKETALASADFYAALGWLAREGKLNVVVETRCGKDCEYYTL